MQLNQYRLMDSIGQVRRSFYKCRDHFN
jgi:hypothetical protein